MRTAASGVRLVTPATCRRAGQRRATPRARDVLLKGKTKQMSKPTVEDDLRAELVDQRAKMIAARREAEELRALVTTSEAAEAAAKREAAEAERTMRRHDAAEAERQAAALKQQALEIKLRSRVEKLEQELDERKASERSSSRASRRWASG